MIKKFLLGISLLLLILSLSACAVIKKVIKPTASETIEETGDPAENKKPDENVPDPDVPDPETVRPQYFTHWNEGAPALVSIQGFVEAVTKEGTADYIPPENRIAVFDIDGTVYCETFPVYADWIMFASHVLEDTVHYYSPAVRKVAEGVAQAEKDRIITGELGVKKIKAQAEAYKGVSVAEYREEARRFCSTKADGFKGLLRGDAFYLPMLDIIDYLQDYGFTVYLCGGMNRIAARSIIEGKIDIPPRQVIGTDFTLKAPGQSEGQDAAFYDYAEGGDLLMDGEVLLEAVMTNKVFQLEQEVGQKPVLVFGGSGDDFPMIRYAVQNNPFKSKAFVVINDDTEREWGDPDQASYLKSVCTEQGWDTISMRNDWKTIYGENVEKAAESSGPEEEQKEASTFVNNPQKAATETAGEKASGTKRISLVISSVDQIIEKNDQIVLRGTIFDSDKRMELVADDRTVFDASAEMEFFGNYEDGDTVIGWYKKNLELFQKDPEGYSAKGMPLQGVFDVSYTDDHIDRFYGSYWWD